MTVKPREEPRTLWVREEVLESAPLRKFARTIGVPPAMALQHLGAMWQVLDRMHLLDTPQAGMSIELMLRASCLRG
jgi:hypothetical protein